MVRIVAPFGAWTGDAGWEIPIMTEVGESGMKICTC